MKKNIGYLLLSLPFIAVFIVGYYLVGLWGLLLVIAILLSILVCISIGGSLVFDNNNK